MPKKDRFNFNENILKLSRTTDVETLEEEWAVLDEKTDLPEPLTCVCNAQVKAKVFIIYNHLTHQFAYAGNSCVRKFKPKTNRRRLGGFVDFVMERVAYVEITDIFKYSEDIRALYTKFMFEKLMQELRARFYRIRRQRELKDLEYKNNFKCVVAQLNAMAAERLAKQEAETRVFKESFRLVMLDVRKIGLKREAEEWRIESERILQQCRIEDKRRQEAWKIKIQKRAEEQAILAEQRDDAQRTLQALNAVKIAKRQAEEEARKEALREARKIQAQQEAEQKARDIENSVKERKKREEERAKQPPVNPFEILMQSKGNPKMRVVSYNRFKKYR